MKRKITNIFPRRVVLLASVVSLTTIFMPYRLYAESLSDAKSSGVIISIANNPPLTMLDTNGAPVGVGPELDQDILREAGITQFSAQVMEYGAMIPAVQSKRATMTSSGALVIKPERCEVMLFSDPVGSIGEALIVRKELVGKVKSYKDVAKLGLKIGVSGGSTEQKMAIEAGINESDIVVFPDAVSGMKLMADKRIDVFAHDSVTAGYVLKSFSQPGAMTVLQVPDLPMLYLAAGFSKDSAELRDAYNEGLRKVRANGKYKAILEKYGQEDYGRNVDQQTTAQLCGK